MEMESYIRAGYPAIILNTAEEERALKECKNIANRLNKNFAYWSITGGIQTKIKDYSIMTEAEVKREIEFKPENDISDPTKVLEEALKNTENRKNGEIFLILDFHPFIKTVNVWRRAKDVFKIAKALGITYVFVSVEFEVPPEIKREVIITELPLPTREELKSTLTNMANSFEIESPSNVDDIVEVALGLTINEAENAFATSIAKYGRFDVKLISKVKEQTICNGSLLEYKSSDETLENIGGLKNFTTWAQKRISAYSKDAQDYGIPYPKGTLLIGVPGCGKSLSAKALSNLWQKPLLKLDIGKLFSSFVGDTELNTRKALKTAEAMAPAILWIDEIEKGLSGIQSSGKTDSGVTSRMFGTILTWLQEKEAPIFVIATANNISELPPEFLRKGRFDEIFFVDLPSNEERKEIFSIQLKKYNRNPEEFDIDSLAQSAQDYTGAEIEQVIINALFNTWNSNKKQLTTESILNAIESMNPMSRGMMKNQIEMMRKWSEDACIQKANGIEENKQIVTAKRVIIQEES